MGLVDIIQKRRAYRSLVPVEITDELIRDLAECILLAPSCFNNQPSRFVFVYDPGVLEQMRSALTEGNKWAYDASLIVAVFSKKEDDCLIKGREYFLFDTGMATAFLILRATEMGLVAHPIAGYSPSKTREILGIPEDFKVITLVIVGKKSDTISPVLSEKQAKTEIERPERLPIEKVIFLNKYSDGASA